LYLKGCAAKRLTDELPEKSWTKHGVNKLLNKLRDTGTGGQAVADCAVPALKKTLNFFFRSSRSLRLTVLPIVRRSDLFVCKENKVGGIRRELLKQKLMRASCEQHSSRLSAPMHGAS